MAVDYGDGPLLGFAGLAVVSRRHARHKTKKRPEKCPSVSLCICDFIRIKST